MVRERAITDSELEYARSQLLLRQRRKISLAPYAIAAILYGSTAFILLFACTLYFEEILLQKPPHILTIGSVLIPLLILVCSLAFGVKSYVSRKKLFVSYLLDFERDIKSRIVEEFVFENAPIIEIQTDTPHGANYLVRIDAFRLMFLCSGQYLVEDFNGKWPNSSFKIIRLPKSKEILDFIVSGELVSSVAILKSSTNSHGYVFGDVVCANWEEVLGGNCPV